MQEFSYSHFSNRNAAVVVRIAVGNMDGFVGFRQNVCGVFAPFDEHNAAAVEIFVKADLEQRFTVENAVQVEVRDIDRRRFVFVCNGKGRAGDAALVAESVQHAARECGRP